MSRIRFFLLILAALATLPTAAAAQAVPDSVLAVTRSGVSILRANVDGKVGIGTSTPDRKLTVNGTIAAADTIVSAVGFKFPDGSVQTTAAVSAGPASGTSANTPNTLVARDATGSFAAGKVTLDSLAAGKARLDSLTAGRARLDSLSVAGVGRLDSLAVAAGARLDSLKVTGGGIRFADGSLQSTAATTATGTSANTPSTLVQRDASGGFAAGEVTLDSLTAGKARLDSLAVTGSGIRFADGSVQSTAATSATGTSANTPSTLVQRDANGAFSAGEVTLDSLTAGKARLDSLAVVGGARLDSLKVTGGGIRFADGSLQSTAATSATGTSANTPNALVQRDATGGFAAGEVTLDSLTAGNARLDSLAVTGTGIRGTKATLDSLAVTGAGIRGTKATLDSLAVTGAGIRGTKATLDSLAVAGRTTLGSSSVIVEPNSALSANNDSVLTVRTGSTSRFRVNRDGGLLAEGSYSSGLSGTIPAEGSGTRFLWYPMKAAIRAGTINGTQWDDANIGEYSTAFGQDVRALGDGAVAIGQRATAAGSRTIAIGEDVTATGANSVVLGYKASSSTSAGSPRLGSFVFGDRSTTTDTMHATLTNSAHWRVANGFYIYTSSNLSTGVNVTAGGGSWNTVSDRNRKENILAVDGEGLLARLRTIPVSTWNYIAQGRQVRHMGPMAQDWERAFGFSGDSLTINTGDIDGVNLAGVKALDARTVGQESRIATLERENAALRTETAELRARLEAIERMLHAQPPAAAPPPRP